MSGYGDLKKKNLEAARELRRLADQMSVAVSINTSLCDADMFDLWFAGLGNVCGFGTGGRGGL